MTVEEVRGSLDLTDNGAIRNSIRNCLTVFQNDPYLQGAIRYNILTERIDIVKPLWWEKPTATLNDTDFNYLMLYLEDKYGLTSEKKIEKAISIVGKHKNVFRCLWATHSLFVGKSFCESRAILFFGGTQKWIK